MTFRTAPLVRVPRSARGLALTGLAGLLGGAWLTLLVACKTAPPPPPVVPTPTPEAPAVVPTPTPVPLFVKVTGSRLNVREAPGTDRRTIAKVKRGERLEVLGEEAKWMQVKFGKDLTPHQVKYRTLKRQQNASHLNQWDSSSTWTRPLKQ